MEIFIILALVAAVILIVGYPLVNSPKGQSQRVPQGITPENNELYGKREIVLEALRDLQFEFATGKLSAGDYEQLKGRYELEAAQVLYKIDALKPGKHKTPAGARTCPRCRAAMTDQEKFCTRCGAKL